MADAQYSVGDYHFDYICNGQTTGITLSQPVDEIMISPGQNKMVISKTGDSLKFSLNDLETRVRTCLSQAISKTGYCRKCCLSISLEHRGILIVYKNFEVKYKGDQIPVE